MDRERLRAADAFSVVSAGNLGERDRFLTLARELPAMLQTNGLLTSWAFLLAKKKDAHHLAAVRALAAHLRAAGLVDDESPTEPESLFVERWLATEAQGGLTGLELRRLTAEAISYAVWLKRAAEAVLSGASQATGPSGEPPAEGQAPGEAGP